MFWKKFQNWNSVFGKLFQFGILILEKNSNSGIFLGFFSKFQLVIYIWNFPNLEIRNFVPHFTNIGKFHCAVERTNPLLSCYCCPMCLQCVSSVSSDTLVVEYFLQGLQGFLPSFLPSYLQGGGVGGCRCRGRGRGVPTYLPVGEVGLQVGTSGPIQYIPYLYRIRYRFDIYKNYTII